MSTFRFARNPKRIKAYLNDSDKKNIFLILKELIFLSFLKKEIPYYYFKHLYKREVKNIGDYLGTKERALVQAHIESKYELSSIMQNKLSFAIFCEKFGLKAPKAIAHNFSSFFLYQGHSHKINSTEELIAYFKNILKSEKIDELFARPLSLLGGKGCFKLTSENLETIMQTQRENLTQGSYLFTKVIEQHPEINKIHKNSVNTIRMLTQVTDTGDISLLSAAMRFGIGESVVDNNSSGGFYIAIDLENGTFHPAGWTKTLFGGVKLTHHPDSNYKLEGFKIPFYQEACQMVIEYAEYIPNSLIGWDVAITPGGPIIIEANHNPYLGLSDIAADGLLKKPSFKKLVEEISNQT